MPVSLRPIAVIGAPGNRTQRLFAQLVFSGNYATGGDSVTYDAADAPSYAPVYIETPMIGAGQPPVAFRFENPAQAPSFKLNLVKGVKAFDFLIKVYEITVATGAAGLTSAELAAGAYPAALTAATDAFVELEFQSNI